MADESAPDDEPVSAPDDVSAVAPSVRAQLLATEHWSLLASRSTAQNEVLVRINMFLTLVSAGLVSLALVGQATQFSDAFVTFAIAVLGIVNLVGILTQVRVFNVAMEDLMYVLAMNRLRGAYVELDPGIEKSLMSSRFDDREGMEKTYLFPTPRRNWSHVPGSSMVFIVAVNASLFGLLIAAVTGLTAASTPVLVVAGVLAGAAYFTVSIWLGGRPFFRHWKSYVPRYPSPPQ